MTDRLRHLNGYVLVYKPDYPKSMKSDNWLGFVYQHIYVAEEMMGRSLTDTEEVHHLNGVRDDNRRENLLVLESSQHTKLHNWLRSCGIDLEGSNANRVKTEKPKYCEFCEVGIIKTGCNKFCSMSCYREFCSKDHPSQKELEDMLNTMSMEAIGRKYGISGNAVKKWIKKYKATPCQAPNTFGEGVETSGEV